MPINNPNVYEDTEEKAIEAGNAALRYIYDGEVTGLPLEFRGLKVFGVIKALRENDEKLHGEENDLTQEQQVRLDEIESDLVDATSRDLQYYPFGHKRNMSLDDVDKRHRERAGTVTSWGTHSRRTLRKRSSHAAEFIVPPL